MIWSTFGTALWHNLEYTYIIYDLNAFPYVYIYIYIIYIKPNTQSYMTALKCVSKFSSFKTMRTSCKWFSCSFLIVSLIVFTMTSDDVFWVVPLSKKIPQLIAGIAIDVHCNWSAFKMVLCMTFLRSSTSFLSLLQIEPKHFK